MCGFLGNIFNKKYFFDKRNFIESAKLIEHRGPDDKSSLYNDNLSIIFYRLSIRDKTTNGRQPMMSKSKRHIICFNGEIYNTNYLKKKYLKDFRCKSESDTEILLESFEREGKSVFNDLEGMYAFFIYNINTKKSFLVRDRFGIKPLYFNSHINNFIFSSEIKPILKFNNKVQFSKYGLLDFFLKGALDHDKTFFKNIDTLNPGQFIELNNNKIKSHKNYWWLKEKNYTYDFDESKNNLKFLINKSIEKHIISDRKVGLFLSGGQDSSLIANELKNLNYKTDSFTYDFIDSKNFGESSKSKKIASSLGMKNYTATVNSNYIINNFEKLINTVESPITSMRLFGVLKNYELAKKKNFKVILEGHGGDEQFGGYKYNYIFNLIDSFNKNKNINLLVDTLINNKFFGKLNKNKLINILMTLSYQFGSTTDGTPFIDINYFNKEFLNTTISEDYFFSKRYSKNFLKNSQYKDINIIKIPRVLKYTDRLSMINGIETRVPFLDHKLFEFSFNLKNDYKYRNNDSRFIMKETFNISRSKRKNKKTIVDPQTQYLKNDLKEYVYSIINSQEFINSDYFDQKYIKKSYENFLNKPSETSFNLMQVISTQVFFNQFRKI